MLKGTWLDIVLIPSLAVGVLGLAASCWFLNSQTGQLRTVDLSSLACGAVHYIAL